MGISRYYADTFVVGAGGSGLIAAIEASKHSGSVAVVSKGKAGHSGATVMAPGGIAAIHDLWRRPGDSKELHEKEAYAGGDWLNNQELMGTIAEEIGEVLISLEKMGALWEREPDGKKPRLKTDGGHSHDRSLFVQDRVGREIMRALKSEILRRNIPVYDEIMIVSAIKGNTRTGNTRVTGAVGFDLNSLEPVLIECKSLVIASGGAGMVYSNTSNPIDLTGDGYALCAEAGAQLIDMEFVQFFPIGMLFPEAYKGILGGTAMYSLLYNSRKERFMERYDPVRMEKSTRDYISRAIMQEVAEGRGTPRGGVWCDCSCNEPGFFKGFLNYAYQLHLSAGIDMDKDPYETAPSSHFFMGGVKVGKAWNTGVDGLYCIGEAAGGAHGSNRISQNALSDILVSGVIAGREAAKRAAEIPVTHNDPQVTVPVKNEINSLLSAETGIRPLELRKRLRDLMWEGAGVLRSEASLKQALENVKELERMKISLGNHHPWVNQGVMQAFENKSLVCTAKAVILSALARAETRGSHYRSDYPETNESWLKNIVLTLGHNGFEVSTQEVAFTRMKKGEA